MNLKQISTKYMIKKDLLDIVESDVETIFSSEFNYTPVEDVPSIYDPKFTYANGDEQKGEEIKTCVLFVDIRDSVKMNSTHYLHTKGRMYTSFVRSVLRAAKHHNGKVRNIIGDRIMVVFPVDNCFKNAVDCAVSINHIANHIINAKLSDFRVGIGIDYGKMKVYKVGLPLASGENIENKNFVWIGEPANFASRLTDVANKKKKDKFTLHKYFKLPKFLNGRYSQEKTESLDADELAERLPNLPAEGVDRINVEKERTGNFQSILITEDVFEGLKQQDPQRNSIKKGLWSVVEGDFRGVTKKVYQADLIWII